MKYLRTYKGSMPTVEDKVNLIYKSEIENLINVVDVKLSLEQNEVTANIFFNIRNDNKFKDFSHINLVGFEKFKRSRVLTFEIEDGRNFKIVMSNRFLFGERTGLYYDNKKIGRFKFKNDLKIENLKTIVLDFFYSTGILISIEELKSLLNFEEVVI